MVLESANLAVGLGSGETQPQPVRAGSRGDPAVKVSGGQGSDGIDSKSITETAGHWRDHWPAVRAALEAGNDTPAAGRGVAIPKRSGHCDRKGERLLGIAAQRGCGDPAAPQASRTA